MNYITTRRLHVRSKMDTRTGQVLRTMSQGEGFVVYETYQIKGPTGLQKWGRVSNNAGDVSQEFTCLAIGNQTFAKEEAPAKGPFYINAWVMDVDAFLRSLGFKGAPPQ